MPTNCLRKFQKPILFSSIPEKFPNPFDYKICPIARQAAEELQAELELNKQYNNIQQDIEGKMYGVLVVQDKNQDIYYLAAFSGKLETGNKIEGFVPPVYDLFDPNGFFRKGEKEINIISRKIEQLESEEKYLSLKERLKKIKHDFELELQLLKTELREFKKERDLERLNLVDLPDSEYTLIRLAEESVRDHFRLKDLKRSQKKQLSLMTEEYSLINDEIESLKKLRKNKSSQLQDQIFEEFSFLNSNSEKKSLNDIFSITENNLPPSGTGECAAPKLLQYAFKHGYRIISLAEFWWGSSPESEIRHHKNFYPPCRGKCVPILGHMLSGIEMNTIQIPEQNSISLELPILYEDEYLMAINKPIDLLSVPGLTKQDSVYSIIKSKHPEYSGPLIVHRLDMSTSGIMLIPKNLQVYQNLQSQFTHRKIKKTYIAILEREIDEIEGEINLPIRVDLDDRPRQMVCKLYGKPAITQYRVITKNNGTTRIRFSPLTGRTHQLRVHSAHKLGLAAAIVGDELYGIKGERLMLHASQIIFLHPMTGKEIEINCKEPF